MDAALAIHGPAFGLRNLGRCQQLDNSSTVRSSIALTVRLQATAFVAVQPEMVAEPQEAGI